MQGSNVSKICARVINFFSKKVDEINEKVQFSKRESKLNAQSFSEMLITGCLSDDEISLERMCAMLKEREICITKQGLHERFNDEAKLLMENLFEVSLDQFKNEKSDLIELLKPFSAVKITDSTGISLPGNLKNLYRGHGGVSSEAGLKIQLMFDYLYGQVSQVTLTEGRRSDQGFTQYFQDVEKGALYLHDLGYYKIDSFAKIHQNGGYFISRHLYSTTLLDKKNRKIDLYKCLDKSGLFFEKELFLGEKEKVPVRLIAFRLPDALLEIRIRKLRREFQRKGKTPSAEVLKFAAWSIYITNVSKSLLTAEQVYLIYKIRWQIELFFKLCKGGAGINKVRGRSENRVICEIYAKLICIIQFLHFCFPLHWDEENEISFDKAYKSFKMKGLVFFNALKSRYRLFKFIGQFISDIADFGLKDKHRKKRKSTYKVLMDSKAVGAVV